MTEITLTQKIDGFTSMDERTVSLVSQAERMVIASDEDFAKGGDLVKIINTDLKKLDERRKDATKKPRDYVSWVNGEFKKLTDPLNAALKEAKAKMKTYGDEQEKIRREQERLAREEAEKKAIEEAAEREEAARQAREAAEAAQKAADDALQAGDQKAAQEAAEAAEKAEREAEANSAAAEEVLTQAADAPEVDTTLRGARGNYGATAGMRKVWKVDIVSLVDLPDEYQFAITQSDDCQRAMRSAIRDLINNLIKPTKGTTIEKIDVPGLNIRKESEVNVR